MRARVDRRAVLDKAVTNAARRLGLSDAKIAEMFGFGKISGDRREQLKIALSPRREKEWAIAAQFVRMSCSLGLMVGSEEKARAWLASGNRALGGRPVDLISSAQGLIRVLQYLDASRGRS